MKPSIGIAAASLVWLTLSHLAMASEPVGPPPAKLSAFAWLAGYWEGEGLGGRIEDVWMPPRAGVMLGAFRLTRPDGKGLYELFAIEEQEGSLRFKVKHFHPNWVGWEEKDRAFEMPLVRLTKTGGVFAGVEFRREGDDAMVVVLTMGTRDGATRTESLRFRRRSLTAD